MSAPYRQVSPVFATPLDRMRERYEHDPAFHALVDVMRHAISSAQLAPSEVREAAMYAVFIEEMRNPRPLEIAPGVFVHEDPRR